VYGHNSKVRYPSLRETKLKLLEKVEGNATYSSDRGWVGHGWPKKQNGAVRGPDRTVESIAECGTRSRYDGHTRGEGRRGLTKKGDRPTGIA